MRGSGFVVGTMSGQLFLQFKANPFEALQVFKRWSEDTHVLFFRNPEIIFVKLFALFNLDLLRPVPEVSLLVELIYRGI